MKFVKMFFTILGALLVLALIAAAILPKEYDVERSVVIERPKTTVFEYVKLLKNQDNFSVWANMDPQMKKESFGTDGTVGFVTSWDSDNPDVGRGEQEIVGITDGKRIDYELRFIEPWESTAPAAIVVDSVAANQTRVSWSFHGDMDYPMNLMLLFLDMEEVLGADLQNGLNNLKRLLEQE